MPPLLMLCLSILFAVASFAFDSERDMKHVWKSNTLRSESNIFIIINLYNFGFLLRLIGIIDMTDECRRLIRCAH